MEKELLAPTRVPVPAQPKFNPEDQVHCCLAPGQVLRVKSSEFQKQGRTFMYSFHNSTMQCGEMYLSAVR